MYTISPLYQIIHFNVSAWYLKPLNILKRDQNSYLQKPFFLYIYFENNDYSNNSIQT